MTKRELDFREKVIYKIEGYTGSLRSVPFHRISARDLVVILYTIIYDWKAVAKSTTDLIEDRTYDLGD